MSYYSPAFSYDAGCAAYMHSIDVNDIEDVGRLTHGLYVDLDTLRYAHDRTEAAFDVWLEAQIDRRLEAAP